LPLQEFDYKVGIQPRKAHLNADFFLRISGEPDQEKIPNMFPDKEQFQVLEEDTWYAKIIGFLRRRRVAKSFNQEETTMFMRKMRPYFLIKGILHKEGADSWVRLCQEKQETDKVITALHEGCGTGVGWVNYHESAIGLKT
jgi:hypothetical protein